MHLITFLQPCFPVLKIHRTKFQQGRGIFALQHIILKFFGLLQQNNLSNPPTPPASLPPTPPPMACQKMANGFATTEELAGKAGVLVSHEGRRPSPCVLLYAARWQSGCGFFPPISSAERTWGFVFLLFQLPKTQDLKGFSCPSDHKTTCWPERLLKALRLWTSPPRSQLRLITIRRN